MRQLGYLHTRPAAVKVWAEQGGRLRGLQCGGQGHRQAGEGQGTESRQVSGAGAGAARLLLGGIASLAAAAAWRSAPPPQCAAWSSAGCHAALLASLRAKRLPGRRDLLEAAARATDVVTELPAAQVCVPSRLVVKVPLEHQLGGVDAQQEGQRQRHHDAGNGIQENLQDNTRAEEGAEVWSSEEKRELATAVKQRGAAGCQHSGWKSGRVGQLGAAAAGSASGKLQAAARLAAPAPISQQSISRGSSSTQSGVSPPLCVPRRAAPSSPGR